MFGNVFSLYGVMIAIIDQRLSDIERHNKMIVNPFKHWDEEDVAYINGVLSEIEVFGMN